jgi:hypothetical protein
LYDKVVAVNYLTLTSDGAGVVSSDGLRKPFKFHKDVNIPIEFDATSGAIGTIRSNNLGVCLLGGPGIAGFLSKIRLRFSDGS